MTPFFGKKKPPMSPSPQSTDRIVVMPDIFYGGADPTIYPRKQKSTEKVLTPDRHGSSPVPPKKSEQKQSQASSRVMADTNASPSTASPSLIAWFGSHKRLSILMGVGVFGVFVGGVSWYYIKTAVPTTSVLSNTVPVRDSGSERETVPVIVSPPTTPPQISTTTPVAGPIATSTIAVPSTTPTIGSELVFPSQFLTDTPDADNDSLTDIEEEVFGTDPGVWDTDNDGYYDGQEVVNLYNPRGFAPIRIIDSGLVREYVHPTLRYRFYYPAEWQIGTADAEANTVVVSTISTDFVTVVALPRTTGESFETWFARSAPGQRFTDVSLVNNRFGLPIYHRRDGLVSYIVDTNTIVVIAYNTGAENAPVSYRQLFRMLGASFRTDSTRAQLPDQLPIPQGATVQNVEQ